MFKLLLATKFKIPYARTPLVARGQLTARLNAGAASPLILVSAPPGFGKTTLLAAWLQETERPAAWLALDPTDNDPKHFFICLATALGDAGPEIGQAALALLNAPQPVPSQAILTLLINDLAGLPHDFYLILDDYQYISTPEIHAGLTFLVEHSPEQFHLILATRSDPPLPLSRMRARGWLTELRQGDLRFTPTETAAFLNQVLNLKLSPAQIKTLGRRTEGWAAGLQLAGLSIQQNSDPVRFTERFGGSTKFVFDYLVDEVFTGQPPGVQHFLRETAILDRFTSALCTAVTGRDDAVQMLRLLEEANLFLLPLDDQREWYRYHHLFQDFLRTRLDPAAAPKLHQKAAAWFLAHDYAPEAVAHALASSNPEITVLAVTQAAGTALNQGALQTLAAWLEALPPELVDTHPTLAVIKGLLILLTRSIEAARPYIESAVHTLPPNAPDSIRGQLLCLQAHLALCDGELETCAALAQQALERMDPGAAFLTQLTRNLLGQVLELQDDLPAAVEVYQQTFETAWGRGDRIGALILFTNLVFVLNELGRRREAEGLCQRIAAETGLTNGEGGGMLEAIYLPWSLLAYEANQLDAAQTYAERALNVLTAVDFPQGIIWGQYVLALVYLAAGKQTDLAKISQAGQHTGARIGMEATRGAWFAALEAQAQLNAGNLSAAARWAEKTNLSPTDTPSLLSEPLYLTYARVLLAQEQYTAASTLLETMYRTVQTSGRSRRLIPLHLLFSRLYFAQNQPQKAATHLESALQLAVPQDYIQAFLDEGEALVPILLLAKETAPAFVTDLLALLSPASETAPHGSALAGTLVDALTQRELEILRLVHHGFSNREIAAALYVTLGTVKKHLNNIYSKLDAKNRTQAVNRGQKLGLLE